MKNVILVLAVLFATQTQAQVSILDILPADVEQEIEVYELAGTNDTTVYTYEINAIQKIDNLVFVEHRLNKLTNALVYRIKGTPFKVRLVTPDENDEIQDPFIGIYRN
jgi:hypothetical protein